MDFAVVQVQEEAAPGCQQPVRFVQPWFQKGQVIIEAVGEGLFTELLGPVSLTAEPLAVTRLVANRLQPCP